MPSPEGLTPHGDMVDEALRGNHWKERQKPLPTADSLIEMLSRPEKIASIALLMQTCGDMLGKVPYVNSKVERENGLHRFGYFFKITDTPGPHPQIPFVSFTYYRHESFNQTKVEASIVTPFKLVVASQVTGGEDVSVREAFRSKHNKALTDPVAHTFSYFFSRNGEGLLTLTPALTVTDIYHETKPVPHIIPLTDKAINVARDSMWKVSKKTEAILS